jgi:hypothetical protein
MAELETRYRRGAFSSDELQDALNSEIAAIISDRAALDELARNGLGEDALRGATFSVTEEAVGLSAATVFLIRSAGSQLTSDSLQVLQRVVLRRVIRRRGGDAVGRPVRGAPPPGPDFDDDDG